MADPPDPGSPPPRSDDGENAADPSNSGSSCPASEEPEDFAAPDPLMQLIATARIEDLREAVRTVTRYDETARRCVTGSLADTRRVRANVEMCQTGKRKAVEVCAGCQVDFHEEENKQGRCSVYLFHPSESSTFQSASVWSAIHTRALCDRAEGRKGK